ncbi:MAG: DUF5010 domain-containing protein [Candidatus Lloydbacteria bacterium]|nr:DUF5010 domain-containing protein [Candidatus Lloydbacteria bacterium]
MKKILIAIMVVFFLITTGVQVFAEQEQQTLTVPTNGQSFVRGLYACILGREPSANEVDGWLNAAATNGMAVESAYRSFLFSDEYQVKRTSDSDFIGALYRCILYKEPDVEGMNDWAEQLNTGARARYQIMEDIIDSAEFRQLILPRLKSATNRDAREAGDTAAIGPYANILPQGASFASTDKVLMTPFFFWFNAVTGEAMTNNGIDRLTHHPVSLTSPPYSFASKDWWEKELKDVNTAGIDVILPVYWGFPDPAGRSNDWSYGGITTMVAALRDMDARGEQHPKVGMFYDTSTLGWNSLNRQLDLRTDRDRDYFYRTIRDYFSMVPPQYRAMIDGKPVIVLYEPTFSAGYDQGAFEYVYSHFERDFGVRPYIIVNSNWTGTTTDGSTKWGAAVSGPYIGNGVAQIGPGYDQSALVNTGERTPLITNRRDGNFYRESWDTAVRSGKSIIIIETWNELNEGSDVSETREFGRLYLDITREYADRWRMSGNVPIPTSRESFARYLGSCILGRATNPAEISILQQTSSMTTLGQIYSWVFGSPEYLRRATTNDMFVAQLYRCVLFRTPDVNEIAYWVRMLNGAMSRTDMLYRFTASPDIQTEFQIGVGRVLQSATGFGL